MAELLPISQRTQFGFPCFWCFSCVREVSIRSRNSSRILCGGENGLAFLRDHKKHLIASLKENQPSLLAEAKSLCARIEPIRCKKGKNEYLWWDIEGILTRCSAKSPVRVVRSRETKPSKDGMVTTDWFWITTFSKEEARTETVWRIGHKRWDIENHGFNYLGTRLKIDHNYRHDQNAIRVNLLRTSWGFTCRRPSETDGRLMWKS